MSTEVPYHHKGRAWPDHAPALVWRESADTGSNRDRTKLCWTTGEADQSEHRFHSGLGLTFRQRAAKNQYQ